MKSKYLIVIMALLALACSLASAYDPSPLQDFCVAVKDPASALFVNGKFCKDPKLASANDFFFSGLNIPSDTSNLLGSNSTAVNVDNLAGLNTLGVSLSRVDYAPYGLNPPHTHPRGSEGLIHFQLNVGKTKAVALAGFNSQNAGVITIANAVFGSDPKINPDVLTKAFQVDKKLVEYLQKQF
ncbi:germin-like protein subfamily 1 member 13 isoform X2 [Juglans regia]|uniref:Germin-like protein subfamily 1 member 13 isoform X2 n=1 Tax=Juglans regia TaxID=51240 RepID=A0A6P9E4J7_JUGRE|nr:germin-like protein subfamily 1 member 13 isoform X2 [Juglans regia]